MTDLEQRATEYRALRSSIETAVLPLATSVDGRTFAFQASLHGLELRVGGYVMLEDAAGVRLGQVHSLGLVSEEAAAVEHTEADTRTQSRVFVRLARGAGAILDGDGRPFHDALARPATPAEVDEWLTRTAPRGAQLEVGELALAPGVPCRLNAEGFARHTFLCGQSGSGKTYALGVVLERLLLETDLRIVILDPNSDYVALGRTRPEVEAATAARYAEATVTVTVRRDVDDDARLSLRVRDLHPDQQAALLRLDPIADREEYAQLAELVAEAQPKNLRDLHLSEHEAARRLALRGRNLGVDRWTLWVEPQVPSLADDVAGRDARCLVVDLGSLGSREEQALVAGAVLRRLWHRRAEREPILLVIDEAHNVCPQRPEDALTALATEEVIRIAGEGRKFGLYLLLATQRPQKLHENVLSQCDNLLLMRMNSAADLGVVEQGFSFVPPGLLACAGAFRQGEALAAGRISSHPVLARFGARFSVEGGSDVEATWARRAAG
jgi:DNA helicase HerA-like ATPase